MFGRRIHLFTIFGFAISIDFSWFFLVVLVTWSLATGVFPAWYPDLPGASYWLMGAAGAFGLFASIVLHELSHSLVARQHGVVMRGITLFIFGGVAEMTDEPPSPKAEFQVAIAGPLMSIAVAFVSYGLYSFGGDQWPVGLRGGLRYLAIINGVLVLFNMIPAFPLDGGRVLRSILWHYKKSLSSATRVTARIGTGFAFLLIAVGALRILTGDVVGGIWSGLIGLFLRGAANMSYQQVLVRKSLEGEKVRRFMKPDPVTVPADISIAQLVEDYLFRYHYKMFPVVRSDALIGCITTGHIKTLARDEWNMRTVADVAEPCTADNSIEADEDATSALSTMSQSRLSRLVVLENGRLVGIITLKDLLHFLSLKVELGGR
jgi:Zn-dependent protease